MSGSYVALAEIVEFMRNGTTATQNLEGRGYPITRIETISNSRVDLNRVRHVVLSASEAEKWRIDSGDILLSHINSVDHIGKSAIYNGEIFSLIHGMNLLLLRPNKKLVIPDFLAYALKTEKFRALVRSKCKQAVNQASINQKELGSIPIRMPSIPEQRRLVDLLSRAEGILRLRREAQAKTAELIPALFLDMFGDPASNPKEWPVVALSDVSSVGSGSGFPIADQGRNTGDYPFYKVGDMNLPGNEEAMTSSRNYIDEATRKRLRATAFPAGAVIFPKIGAAIATNKKRVLSMLSCVDNNVMAVVPSSRLSPAYLHSLFMQVDLSDFASDSSPPSIRKTTIEDWQIPFPPIELQHQFAVKVEAVRAIAAQQVIATTTAQATFDALLHQSFQH